MTDKMTVGEMVEKIVKNDVFCNVGQFVSWILPLADEHGDAPVTWEDFDSGEPDWDEMDRDQMLEWLEENVSANLSQYADLSDYELIQECQDNWEAPEIYEFWAVSGWLADKLRAQGEAVASGYPEIWGRATTGQAISLDGVIRRIAADLLSD
jgi:hypothetical protein